MAVYAVYFSPTGGTKNVCITLAEAFDRFEQIDITMESQAHSFNEEDICFVAVPSFGGRVPATACDRLRALDGNGAKAIVVAVYGNRAFEDTLIELSDVLVASKFVPVAGVSAVAEHSIFRQFAAGRPNETDKDELARFGTELRKRLATDLSKVATLPGNRPYRTYGGVPIKPKTVRKACTKCGLCATQCPTKAIDSTDFKTDGKLCISCMRCVQLCPSHARKINATICKVAATSMKKVCSERKENKLYL